MKNNKLFASLAIVSVILFAGCKKDDFVENVGLCPLVVSTNPAIGATSVPTGQIITVAFNERMNPATITQASFILQGVATVNGTISYSDTIASFTPFSPLTPNTTYTGRITTSVKDLKGNALQKDYVWTFSTGETLSPMVIATTPANNATSIALNQILTAQFSVPMDPLTLTASTFTVKQGATPITGTVSYAGGILTFTPAASLNSDAIYTATITTGAKNIQGTPLAFNHVWKFSTQTNLGPPSVNLKTVARFGIIASTSISSNAGQSEIHDLDVGISTGVRSSITGFPPAIIVNGDIYASDDIVLPGIAAMLTLAKQDLSDAYDAVAEASFPAPVTVSGDLGGRTLTPGIYKSSSTLLIQGGNLVLDAQGDANAVWIFQVASDLITIGGAGGNVSLTGGAQAKNIFWQTGSSATIGDNTSFKGNVLALTSITMNSGAVADGRMLAKNGAVVLINTNIINKP